ncbi:MAG: nucleotidyl transferase AbiEii/AbiGii toxin family protein [Bacteroidetes bacterium]|nr:nucleotidyl transferase AbiEii/AbiGii toxin family protein [Bacteroidota bacterium]
MSKANAISMKLLEVSKKNNFNHQLLLIRFFQERLLYRLSVSAYKNKLLLKGGNLLYSWQGAEARPTVDIDFAAQQLSNEANTIKEIFTVILAIDAHDEVQFDTSTLTVTEINEQNEYNGIRLKVVANLGNIRQHLQIDIGFGDVVTPEPIFIDYPIILEDFAIPNIVAYTMETVIAEKLHAMIVLAQLNSRMKDFYDVYTIIQSLQFNNETLKLAIIQTFENRNTELNLDSVVFTEDFYQNQQRQSMWYDYLKKINAEAIDLKDVMVIIKAKVYSIFFNT